MGFIKGWAPGILWRCSGLMVIALVSELSSLGSPFIIHTRTYILVVFFDSNICFFAHVYEFGVVNLVTRNLSLNL